MRTTLGGESSLHVYQTPEGTSRFRVRCMGCRQYSKRGRALRNAQKTFSTIAEARAWWEDHVSTDHTPGRKLETDHGELADRIMSTVDFDTP